MPKINHKLIYFILAIIVLLILIMSYLYFYKAKKPQQIAQSNPFSSVDSSEKQPTNPFISSSPITADCSQEKTDSEKDACWLSKAVADKNPTICNNIKGENPFVSKDACLNFVAQARKEISICTLITNQELKKNCEDNIK